MLQPVENIDALEQQLRTDVDERVRFRPEWGAADVGPAPPFERHR